MDETQALLEQLEDITLPAPSGFPLAPGWVALIVLCLFGSVLLIWLWRRKRSMSSVPQVDWQSPALAELRQIEARLEQGDSAAVLADCSRLARRVSLAKSQRREVASLTGHAWLRKLDQLTGNDFFTRGAGRQLAHAPYRPSAVVAHDELVDILTNMRQMINNAEVNKA